MALTSDVDTNELHLGAGMRSGTGALYVSRLYGRSKSRRTRYVPFIFTVLLLLFVAPVLRAQNPPAETQEKAASVDGSDKNKSSKSENQTDHSATPTDRDTSALPPATTDSSEQNPVYSHVVRHRKHKHSSAASVVNPPAASTDAPAAPQPRSSDDSGVFVVLFLLFWVGALSFFIFSKRRQDPAVELSTTKQKALPQRATRPQNFSEGVLPTTIPATNRLIAQTSGVTWLPPGTAIQVAGHVVSGGMIYFGKPGRHQRDMFGGLIDPSLTVTAPLAGAVQEKLGYWPSYASISPQCRWTYLNWLSTGKTDPTIDIGYVFLYFYGLELRLLKDQPEAVEVDLLVLEINRLRELYASNSSFDGYSRRLVDLIEMVRFSKDEAQRDAFRPDLSRPQISVMPLQLKFVIALKVMDNVPLDFELATAGLLNLPWDIAPRNTQVMDHTRELFLRSFRVQFEKAFPGGFALRDRKGPRLSLDYRPASQGLPVKLNPGAKLATLAEPAQLDWSPLVNLAAKASQDLEPYSKLVAYHPERANSLSALAVCPPEFVADTAIASRSWLQNLETPISVVPFGEVAFHAIGAASQKWTLRQHRLVAEALANLGCCMEPNPTDGSVALEDTTEVMLIATEGQPSAVSASFPLAANGALLLSAIVQNIGLEPAPLEFIWLKHIQNRLKLTGDDVLRLRARLLWLRKSTGGLAKAKRLLASATSDDVEAIAESVAYTCATGGALAKSALAILEGLYDKLDVPRSKLYTTIHGAVASSAAPALEPVTVAKGASPTTHPIAKPARGAGAVLDEDRLQRVRSETAQVASVLADIFNEEQEVGQSAIEDDQKAAHTYSGLDNSHAALIKLLVTRPTWTQVEFETAAHDLDLMPSGALEVINEWAYEKFDEPLIEVEEPMTLNAALLG